MSTLIRSTFRPHQRVIAKTDEQGLAKGRTYHVVEPVWQPCEVVRIPLRIVAYKVSTWPERNAQELIVKAGILHLREAREWGVL